MYTTTGPVGDGKYYIRIEGDGDPDDGDSREYSDAPASTRSAQSSTPASSSWSDSASRLPTTRTSSAPSPRPTGRWPPTPRSGRMWHRYTYDGYGERADGSPWTLATGGIGRLWPLLSGERGEYELANGARRPLPPAHHAPVGQRRLHDPGAGVGPARAHVVRS